MNFISGSNLKKINNLLVPNYSKLKIIDEIGVDDFLQNYPYIVSKIKNYDKHYLLSLLLRKRKDKFINFFKSIDIKNYSNFELLQMIAETDNKLFVEVINVIDISVINEIILSNSFSKSVIKKIYKIRKNDINLLLDDAIKYNNYFLYFKNYTIDEIEKYIVNKLDMNTIINIIFRNGNWELKRAIEEYREQDIIDYAILNSKNIYKIQDLLKFSSLDSLRKKLLNLCTLDDDTLSFIFKECGTSLKELLYSLYEDQVNNWLDSIIDNFLYFDYIKYGPENVVTYVVSKLKDEQIDKLIKYNRLHFSTILSDKLYEIRSNDVIKIISKNIGKDNLNVINYLYHDIPKNVLKEVFNNINVGESFLNKILDDYDKDVFKNVFSLFKNEMVLLAIKNIRGDRISYINKYIIGDYPFDFKKELSKELTQDEIFEIIGTSYVKNDIKNYLFDVYKDSIIGKFIKLLSIDFLKAKMIFNNNPSSDFRKYLIDNLDFNYLYMLINELNNSEIKEVSEKYKSKLLEKMKYEHDMDLLIFFDRYIVYAKENMADLAMNIITSEDIMKIICDGYGINYNTINNKKFSELLKKIVTKDANYVKNLPYNQCLSFLKGLRYVYDNLFFIFLNNIDLDDDFLHKLFIERGLSDKQKVILFDLKKNDIFRIVKEKIQNKEIDPIEYIQKGTPEEILKYVLPFIDKNRLIELLNDPNFIKRKSIGMQFALKLAVKIFVSDDNKLLAEEIVKCYSGNALEFLKYFEIIKKFLEFNKIDVSKFWQYSLNTSYNFIDDVVKICQSDLRLFLNAKNILFNYVYDNNREYSYKEFLDIIKNYIRYNELCVSLTKLDDLSVVDFKNIKLLFKQTKLIPEIKSYKDCENIINVIKNEYLNKERECKNIDDYRLVLNQLLFNCDTDAVRSMLDKYGRVENLLQLKYYNLDKIEVLNKIDEIIYYTNLMEEINMCDDEEVLANLLNEKINNIYFVLTDFKSTNYEELMRELYAIEMDLNLSKVGYNVSLEKVKLEGKSNEYGVDVYDFSDKQYTLLAHVVSETEDIEDLIAGNSCGTRNFISFSAISHRMQSYYYNARNIIFGYDEMPYSNFVCSSNYNMGSNGFIKNNSSEIDSIRFSQRGVQEISDTSSNSEILSLREGIKPKYIICPGRLPMQEEIECALKYNLKIVLTQGINRSILSPKDISIRSNVNVSRNYLIDFKSQAISCRNKQKIALLTDSHGILEPTITVLEDIRKKGITKIYSLGDNIGTGSNPSEVVDILNHYGVKCVKGNHELYLINGVDSYKTHLDKTGSYVEESINTLWTFNNLRSDQIKIISEYEDYFELEVNGKKILLCHYLYDYNSEEELYDESKYDLIVQGHKHFGNIDGKVVTLKAVGIGNSNEIEKGMATYMVISPENGTLNYEFINIPYSYKNSINAANISDNNSNQKIMRWIGKIV